jgi:hypothetical protein
LLTEHVREQFIVGVMALAVLLNDSFEWLRHGITMYSRSRVNECISLHGNTNVNHLTWLYDDRLESCVCIICMNIDTLSGAWLISQLFYSIFISSY